MNRPLMFMNNNVIVEQLKTRVWEKYQEISGGDFKNWYNGLSPVEQCAWDVKFKEIQYEEDEDKEKEFSEEFHRISSPSSEPSQDSYVLANVGHDLGGFKEEIQVV